MARKNKGCILSVLGCLGVALIASVAVGFYLYNKAKEFGETVKNPEPKTLEMLGMQTMPEGYYANFAFKIPFLMDMVLMSNQPGTFSDDERRQGQPFGDEGLIYMKFINFKKSSGELQDYFEGKSENDRVLSDNGIHIDVDEVLGRGTVTINGSDAYYLTQRGSINTNGGARAEGLITLVLIRCPDDNKMRFGVWYGPDNQAETGEASASESDSGSASSDLTGTVGDKFKIQSFFGQFQFCTK